MLLATIVTKAQNIQLHYDYGKDRAYLTSTVEMFKPDKWGTTFFFIDMDYSIADNVDGVCLAYWEIIRTIKLGKNIPFSAHVEYNGGMGKFYADGYLGAFTINDAYLAGVDYSWNAKDFSKGFSIKTLYKNIRDKNDISFQITGVWYYHAFNKKITFKGFADFWKEDQKWVTNGDSDTDITTKYIFLTEPQLWYNITENLSFGGEVEISNNLIANDFKVMPTVALKWKF